MNEEDIESAIESIRSASITKSSPVDLNATTETLEHLANARAKMQDAVVSQKEMSVSLDMLESKYRLRHLVPWNEIILTSKRCMLVGE